MISDHKRRKKFSFVLRSNENNNIVRLYLEISLNVENEGKRSITNRQPTKRAPFSIVGCLRNLKWQEEKKEKIVVRISLRLETGNAR